MGNNYQFLKRVVSKILFMGSSYWISWGRIYHCPFFVDKGKSESEYDISYWGYTNSDKLEQHSHRFG